jgi:hypothetical protein
MRLQEQLRRYVAAGFAGLWVRSFEQEDAMREVLALCRDRGWDMIGWDSDSGLAPFTESPGLTIPKEKASIGVNLTAVKDYARLRATRQPEVSQEATDTPAADTAPVSPKPLLFVVRNLQMFLGNPVLQQALQNTIESSSDIRLFIVALSNSVTDIPIDLVKHFVTLDHELPGPDELYALAGDVVDEGELPARDDPQTVLLLDAAAGLTRTEALGAFAMSLAQNNALKPDTLWELKSQALRQTGTLEMLKPDSGFDGLGGLDALKQFCLRAFDPAKRNPKARPRGIVLLGPPGTGKSAFCKALGKEIGRPTLSLDVGALMGSLVGKTEERTRQALKTVDAMAPCVLYVDEIEKALSGSSGANDSGVSSRLMGSILTWLNDHTSDVFFVASANDVSKLPPEFTRAERFDGIFFMDLPSASQRGRIWDIYISHYELDLQPEEVQLPDDTNWTGAEIKACCRLSAMFGVSLQEAATSVVPIARTAKEKIRELRSWAHDRCLSADKSGVFNAGEAEKIEPMQRKVPRRSVTRPDMN